MSKTLRTAALVVGSVALIATGVGAALGSAGIATAVGLTASEAVVAAATAGAIASYAEVAALALTVGAAATAKKPTATATGSPDKFSADPDGAIPYLIGRAANAGDIVFRRAWDTADKGDNDRESFVVVLSGGGPISSIDSFTVDDVATTFDSGGNAVGTFHDFMWQKTQLGQIPTSTALTFGTTAGTPPGWGSTRRLHGMAAAAWTLRFDSKGKLFQNGVPKPNWVGHGVLCYDPRKDSTYPGGSGSHRWADPSDRAAHDAARATWEYSANPFLHGLKWGLGVWERDRDDPTSNYAKTFGMGLPWDGIDVDAFVQGANVADANGFLAGGVIFSADNKWDRLKAMLQAGMGEPLMLGARLSCFVNAPKVSLADIDEGDFWGDCTVQATQPRKDRINRIVPRYYQEANGWQNLPGTPVAVSSYYAIDGGQRTKTVDYPLINNAAMIPVACRYDIENAREFGPITMPLGLRFIGYKPGDAVTVTNAEVGLEGQLVLLMNREFEPGSGTVTLIGRSETTAKHAFALGQTSDAPPTPGVSLASNVPTPGPGSWSITGTGIGSGSSATPALTVSGAVDSPVADTIVFEYRLYVSGQAADVNWIMDGTLPVSATKTIINQVKSDTQYEVAVSYQRRGVTGARLIIGPSTTGDGPTRNVPRGPWVTDTEYDVGDIVTLSGSSYLCILDHTSSGSNTPPNATYWTLLAAGGTTGATNLLVRIFKRAASTPSLPTATATVDLTSGAVTGLNNGWTTTVPSADGNPLWESAAYASSTTGTDTIGSGEWVSPVISTGAGVQTFVVEIFKRSATTPALPSATCTWDFTSGSLTGLNNGWTFGSPPASDGNPCYRSFAVALSVGTTDTILSTEWAAAAVVVQDGAPGSGGGATTVAPVNGFSTGSGAGTTTGTINGANTIVVQPGQTVTMTTEGTLSNNSTTTSRDVTLQIQWSINGAAYTSGTGHLTSLSPGDQILVNFTESYANSGASPVTLTGKVVVTAVGGGTGNWNYDAGYFGYS